MSKQTITLTVNGTDLVFEPTTQAYNKYINELSMDDKVAPAHNYLNRIVAADSKDALAKVLALTGAGLKLAAKVNEAFVPELEISIKN
ncbi:phage protein [Oceanimonas sp. GK1]|uniref:putative phage tail assembly chaperone n=1 Tax=Oceanimonas sp. (strain GK1 / IBRC-M 10197) TaxID=511062 RepID=UPI000249537D|nr:putative phage tail assembly chaperone [Oceanimonas sp. GK1]AEY01476.1 phage protein [Oceanimonas sp. GK1]